MSIPCVGVVKMSAEQRKLVATMRRKPLAARREADKRMKAAFVRLGELAEEIHVGAERARMRVWKRGMIKLFQESKKLMPGM